MMNSSRSSRPTKRDIIVIDDDESTSSQPALKSAKREENPIPSPVVVNSQQQELDKWKDKYNRAVRAAGEFLRRAETAEERLNSKDGIKGSFSTEKKRADDLEIRLIALTRLEEANKRAQSNVHLELALENEALKTQIADMKKEHEQSTVELQEKNEELKTEMDNLRKEHQQKCEDLESRNEELKTEMDNLRKEYQQKCEDLESKNEELKTQMNIMRAAHSKTMVDSRLNEVRLIELKDALERASLKVSGLTYQNIVLKNNERELQKRNDELTLKLGQYETAMQPLLQLHLQQKQPDVVAPHSGEDAAAAANVGPSAEVVEHRKTDPLPNSDLSEKLLDLVRQALKCNQLKRGTEAAEKTLNLGTAEMIILAGDAVHPYIRRDLPLLCESKNVPYAMVKSVDALTRVCGEGRLDVCSITRVAGSPLESTITEIKKEVQKIFHPRD